jgi:flagellar biosynthesis/type III secretory pathway protein FliH
MPHEQQEGALLVFGGATFTPGSNVIKAHELHQWVALEHLRHEAQARIQQEITAGTAATVEAIQRRGDALIAERLAQLAEVFGDAACELERAALDLAVRIATKVIDGAETPAFFARAAEHLQALVPPGSVLRVRVHPQDAGALGLLSERLKASGVQHLSVVTDDSLSGPRSMVAETGSGEIDLGCATQLQRIVAEVMRARAPEAGLGEST